MSLARPLILLAATMAVLGLADGQARRAAPAPPPRVVTEVIIQRQMIIRVPRLPIGRTPLAAMSPAPPPIRWVEKKADKCVPLITLAAASVTGADSVDLILNGGRRIRARFGGECPAIDFYSGFYVKMTQDGNVCANRDSIRSRSGGECRIRSFRALVPGK